MYLGPAALQVKVGTVHTPRGAARGLVLIKPHLTSAWPALRRCSRHPRPDILLACTRSPLSLSLADLACDPRDPDVSWYQRHQCPAHPLPRHLRLQAFRSRQATLTFLMPRLAPLRPHARPGTAR
jgi:hypothetical protein